MLKGYKENSCAAGGGGWSSLRRQWERNNVYLDVEVANWNFAFSSCHSTLPVALWATRQPEVWDQVTSAKLDKDVLENRTRGCGQETKHVLRSAATQAAREPQGLAGTELTAVAIFTKVHHVVARIKEFCLQLQDVALICREGSCRWVGWERQTRTRGPQQPAVSQMSLMYLRTLKEAEPDILYKKLPCFIALKTHITLEA